MEERFIELMEGYLEQGGYSLNHRNQYSKGSIGEKGDGD
jgi:hypothetical protein